MVVTTSGIPVFVFFITTFPTPFSVFFNSGNLPKINDLQLIPEEKLCAELMGTRPEDIKCDKNARFRSLDGTCNNLFHKTYGASFIPFRRMLPPKYGDGELGIWGLPA